MDIKSLRNIVWIALFTALMAASSFITIPLGVVPFTMQILMLFTLSLILGSKKAVLVIALYLFLGLIGFPFFSRGTNGIAVLFGPTGGFLLSYLPTAYIAGMAQNKKFIQATLLLLLALSICYVCGTVWIKFRLDITMENAFMTAALPFIIPDLLKVGIAHVIYSTLKRQGKIPQ